MGGFNENVLKIRESGKLLKKAERPKEVKSPVKKPKKPQKPKETAVINNDRGTGKES